MGYPPPPSKQIDKLVLGHQYDSCCWRWFFTCKGQILFQNRPLLTSSSKPLSAELEVFCRALGRVRVILVSFGSTLSSPSKRVDNAVSSVMADAFAKLPQRVILQGREEFRVNKWITYLKSHLEKMSILVA